MASVCSPPTALDEAVLARAASTPTRPLFSFPALARPLTAAQFAELSGRAAALLNAHGVEPGDRIAVWADNGPAWLVLQAAAAWRGAALVALHPALTGAELGEAIKRSRACWLFAPARVRGQDTAGPLARISREAGGDTLRGVVSIGDERHAAGLVDVPGWSDTPPEPRRDANAVVNIQFTSGSTGPPKMVGLTGDCLLRNARWTAEAAGIGPDDRVASSLPLAHAAGLGSGAILCLAVGALWASTPRFHPRALVEQVKRHRCGVLQMVPTMATMLAEYLAAHPEADVASLQIGFAGGAPCPPAFRRATRAALRLRRLVVVYGQTEAGPTISVDPDDGTCAPADTTVGRALPHVQAIVAASGTDEPLPAGREGELLVRGPSIMRGYLDDPAATADALTPGGWLRTGDLARIDARGIVTLTGRLKELIVSGGENVSPTEVESVLLEHDQIASVCVLGRASERWGEEVVALAVPAPGCDPDPEQMIAAAAKRLARHKVPRALQLVSSLPCLPGGKIDRHAAAALIDGQERA